MLSQRHALFNTRCTIQQKICDVIIDSGSTENIVSQVLVKTLGLVINPHPHSYKIGWMKQESEVKIQEVCRVPFSIRKFYKNEIHCDVVDMDACQILLGRLWQYDVDVVHKGMQNIYVFTWKGKKIALLPTHSKI